MPASFVAGERPRAARTFASCAAPVALSSRARGLPRHANATEPHPRPPNDPPEHRIIIRPANAPVYPHPGAGFPTYLHAAQALTTPEAVSAAQFSTPAADSVLKGRAEAAKGGTGCGYSGAGACKIHERISRTTVKFTPSPPPRTLRPNHPPTAGRADANPVLAGGCTSRFMPHIDLRRNMRCVQETAGAGGSRPARRVGSGRKRAGRAGFRDRGRLKSRQRRHEVRLHGLPRRHRRAPTTAS